MKYRAFFSYARADNRIATWLHRRLDRYKTPRSLIGVDGELGPVPAKLHPIFRDRTDLEAGGHVDQSLQEAVEASETLVVLCSPASAKSHWVNQEIETFLTLGREARIFPVIASGEPGSDDPETECFPPALRGRGLLAADLRDIKRPNGVVVGDGKDGGRLKLLAGLLGVPLDRLAQRERRRQRLATTMAAIAAVTFALISFAAVALGVVADQNAKLAERRAALMSIDAARAQLTTGQTDAALLVLLDAATVLRSVGLPDALLITMEQAIARGSTEKTYQLPAGARFFSTSTGLFYADPATHDVFIVAGAQPPRVLFRAGAAPAFVGQSADGTIVVVRDDRKIERRQGDRTEIVGAFAAAGGVSDGYADISLSDDGVLIWQPPVESDQPDAKGPVQLFDVPARRLFTFPATDRRPAHYLRTQDGRRIVFTPGEETRLAIDLDSGTTVADTFETLAFAYCASRVPSATELQRNALKPIVDRFSDDMRFECRASGSSILVEDLHFYSGGGERGDLQILESGEVFDFNEWREETARTWAGAAGDARGYAVNRELHVSAARDTDRTFSLPVAFVNFLGDGRVGLVERGGDKLHVIAYDAAGDVRSKPLSGNADVSPKPLLHPVVCAAQSYVTTNADGDKLTIAGTQAADTAPLEFKLTLQHGGGETTKTLTSPENQRCAMIAAGGRYIAVGATEADINIIDLKSLFAGAQNAVIGTFKAGAWGSPSYSVWGTIFFVGEGPSVIVSQGVGPVVRWDRGEASGKWSSQTIFTGDLPVRSAEPDATGKRLLLREDLGGGSVQARLFSLDAQEQWRMLGDEYKWLYATFAADGDILLARRGEWESSSRVIDAEEAITVGTATLSPYCRTFRGNEFRKSACWPKELGR